jgi:hypothetical protein
LFDAGKIAAEERIKNGKRRYKERGGLLTRACGCFFCLSRNATAAEIKDARLEPSNGLAQQTWAQCGEIARCSLGGICGEWEEKKGEKATRAGFCPTLPFTPGKSKGSEKR